MSSVIALHDTWDSDVRVTSEKKENGIAVCKSCLYYSLFLFCFVVFHFIYLFFHFILFLNLKHCFAKHQNESATGIL